MGLRETLNENPKIITIATIVVIALILGWLLYPSGNEVSRDVTTGGAKVYFSDDDGKTWFPDDVSKIPPFDRNGKQAVRARVYAAGGKEFCNHLERYTPDAQKKMQGVLSDPRARRDPTMYEQIQRDGLEVKAPGAKDWTKMSNLNAAQKIVVPKTPGSEEINP